MMRTFFLFCTVFVVFSSSQSADESNSLSWDDLQTYLNMEKGQSNDIFEELLNTLAGIAAMSPDTDQVSNWKPPKQIEEPVNNIPARGFDAAQASLTDKLRSIPLWQLEERGRLAALKRKGIQDGTSPDTSATGFDYKAYCKQGKWPLLDPRTVKPVPCSVNGNKCPSDYSCDTTTSKTDGFCCVNSMYFPSDSTSAQDQEKLYLNYCTQEGYVPLWGCQPNVVDACSMLKGAVCDTKAKFASANSGFCCMRGMTTPSTTTTTMTTSTTMTQSSSSPTSTSTTASTTRTTLLPSGPYCSNQNVLVEFVVAFNGASLKRCSTSVDCSIGLDCDLSGRMVQDKRGYCCSKPAPVTKTPNVPKPGNAAGTILLSSGMLLVIVVAAIVSISLTSK